MTVTATVLAGNRRVTGRVTEVTVRTADGRTARGPLAPPQHSLAERLAALVDAWLTRLSRRRENVAV